MTEEKKNDKTTEHHAKVISFINMKGGVGKTSLSINVADTLANKGFKTLVIDTDPQFNSTQSLLLSKEISNSESINDKNDETLNDLIDSSFDNSSDAFSKLSNDDRTLFQIFSPANLISKQENLIINIHKNLDLIPGDLKLASAMGGDNSGKTENIDKHIKTHHLKGKYDYILIDCPPTWSILTHSSLRASDYYVIPSKIDYYSSLGIELLQTKIKEEILSSEIYENGYRKLEPLGIIFTMTNGTGTKRYRHEVKRKSKILKALKDSLHVFNTELPYIPTAPTQIILYSDVKGNDHYTNLTNSIDRITTEIISEIEKQD